MKCSDSQFTGGGFVLFRSSLRAEVEEMLL